MEKAYSTLTLKTVDKEKRIIKGVASTIAPDRAMDVVEPHGIIFDLPIAFLWQHDHAKPIGNVVSANRTSKGLEIEVQIANIKEAGSLKDQVEHAWSAIKEGLVRGLSIGFRPLEYDIRTGGGIHYTAIEVFEISAVTIPCNAQATITDIKMAVDKTHKNRTVAVKLNNGNGGVKLSPVVEENTALNFDDSLSHEAKLLAAILAHATVEIRKNMLDKYAKEFGAVQANKVRLMADSLRGD